MSLAARFGGVLLALTKKVRFGWFCFNSTLLARHERCFETAAYERLNDSHIRDNKAMATRTAEQCSLDDLSLNSPWLSVRISIYRTLHVIRAKRARHVSRTVREFANPDLRRRTRNKLDGLRMLERSGLESRSDILKMMAEVDPETLLEWLNMGQGDERDMQLIALEQLCMLLLMADNVDRCFESCPPRTFLPALCRIFLDECAPDNVLEVTARAITYYLDVSAECTRRIIAMDGAVKAICNRLVVAELASRTSKDLAEQCIKVLELICTREAGAVFEAGGLNCVLSFIRDNGCRVHKDTLHSAMAVVSRLCTKMEPQDASLPACVEALSTLLKHEDSHVADGALRCFASLADRFTRRGVDPAPLAEHGLVTELLNRLSNAAGPAATTCTGPGTPGVNTTTTAPETKSSASVSTIISLLSTLCRGSPVITHNYQMPSRKL
uniref:E3 ubiquitin-protein ligase n=1 Tax=Timema cristinae TaxID=61476 RepID=A0A7R9CLQ9_TIMCR|nr:unnamed protein product [Timema cristinae]